MAEIPLESEYHVRKFINIQLAKMCNLALNLTIIFVLFLTVFFIIFDVSIVNAQANNITNQSGNAQANNITNQSGNAQANNITNQSDNAQANILFPLEGQPIATKIAEGGFITIDLKSENFQPNNTDWTYVIDALPIYGNLDGVNKEGDTIPNGQLTYRAATNFSGIDSFTYLIKDDTSISDPGSISISTYAAYPIIDDPILRIIVAILIAIASIAAIIFASSRIIARVRSSADNNPISSSKFWDIIRSNNMDPSLSVFQFFLWTIVLMFSLFSIYLIRILGGVTDVISGPPPVMLLALTGISFATPFVSSLISSLRYPKADVPDTTGGLEERNQSVRPPWGGMLREFGKPSLSRFQMFGWTWISIAIYLFIYSAEIVRDSDNVINMSIPDVFPILVALMGLSEVVFLGAKATVTTQIEITKVFPLQVRQGGHLSIFGLNFGDDRQDVWLGPLRIKSDDREHLLGWSNGRIDIKIPQITENFKADSYEIMVVKGGSSKIAYKGGSPVKITIL